MIRIRPQEVEKLIIYEDEQIYVCHKPTGLAVETSKRGEQDLVSLLRNHRVRKKESPYIGLVHRIDQPVEGLVLVAKTQEAAAALSKQLGKGDFAKEYLAVVEKETKEQESLVHYLKKIAGENRSVVTTKEDNLAKEARLSYETLATNQTTSLIKVTLDTGRHHQIRVQCAAIGHPLVGDEKYGASSVEGRDIGIALCAYHLKFRHPITGKEQEFFVTPQNQLFSSYKEQLDSLVNN